MATPRKKIVSMRQIEVLVEFLENHRDLAIGRLRSKEARALSQRLWAECANVLNAEADGISRSPKEWQKWYTDYKSRILNRQRQIKENIGGTGGGAGVPVIPLGAIEERLCSLIKGNTPVVGRDGTPPDQVRINPIHEIEEVFTEHFGGDTGDMEIAIENTSNVDENGADTDNVIEEIEVRQNSSVSRHPPELVENDSLHQRPRHSRRPTRRLREEEVPQTENNSALGESRRMLIRMETLRCESTQLLAESVKLLAASLVQNAEATKELAQSMRLEKNKCCCCRRRSDDDDALTEDPLI